MKECKYCRSMYDDNLTVCPNCGGNKIITAEERAEEAALLRKESENREQAVATPVKQRKILLGVIVAVVVMVITVVGIIAYNANKPLTNGMTQDQGDSILAEGIAYYENGDYEQAIECLVQLPADSKQYSEAQSVIEKSMQEYKTEIVEKAETYTDAGNYDAAISLIKNAKTLLANDSDLEKLYQDTYRASVLASAEKYIESGDLATALSVIESGQKELPNDVALQDKYATVFSEYKAVVCHDAISAANEYVMANDYPSAIRVLTEATSKIGNDSEVDALLTQYTNSYVDSVVLEAEQIYKPYNIGALDESTAIISKALTVLPDNNELQVELNKYNDLQPISFFDMISAECYETILLPEDSPYKELFKYTVSIDCYRISNWTFDYFIGATFTINLDYQYSKITGVLFQNPKYSNAGTNTSVAVGNIISGQYQYIQTWKGTVSGSSEPVFFEVDISGENEITLKFEGDPILATIHDISTLNPVHVLYEYAYLADVYLWK